MPRVVHFEINADDPKRAIEFYKNVFGWKISKWDGPSDYWLLTTGDEGQPGIDGGLMKRAEPGSSTCNTIDVPSVDACSELIESTVGEVVVPAGTFYSFGVGFDLGHRFVHPKSGRRYNLLGHRASPDALLPGRGATGWYAENVGVVQMSYLTWPGEMLKLVSWQPTPVENESWGKIKSLFR